jgi:CRISPR-associated endoribonuclease Cas6
MRIRLRLRPLQQQCVIPINYQYPLSAAIYKILAEASPQYAAWLHDKGYLGTDGKPRKLFVFSRLSLDHARQDGGFLLLDHLLFADLYVSSPLLEDFINNFVSGLFTLQKIEIGNHQTVARLMVEEVSVEAPPAFYDEMASIPNAVMEVPFTCLSPIVLSTQEDRQGKLSQRYLKADDPDLSEAVRANLLEKFYALTGQAPQNDELIFRLDQNYLQRRGGPDRVSKLITIREGTPEEIKVRGFLAPFTLECGLELLWCAYECGIGEKNSLGFGMIGEV